MKAFVGRAAVTVAVCMSIPTVSFAATSVHVGRGQTLYSIAQDYHVSVDSLMQANGLHSSIIDIGQKLVIPGSTGSKSSTTTASKSTGNQASTRIAVVTVKKGDTISGIAARYGSTTAETLRLNGMTEHSILHIGDKIKVAVGGVSTKSSRSESAVGALGSEVRGMNIVDFAKQFLGVPYQWGGTSPSGFDCSGFVQFVYTHFGIHIARTTYTQWDEGSPATSEYPDIGDLVFFDTDGAGASHVGIYIGNGEFINAEDRGVRIDSLSSSYWGGHYIGARHY